jgi:prevent-host-death family protein
MLQSGFDSGVPFMAKIPSIIPVSDRRKDAVGVLKRTRTTDEPVFITQRGRAAAVLMSIGAFERWLKEREILLQLASGEREIAGGVGHDLDSVLAEADKFLADG